MASLSENMLEYRKQLEKGAIQAAYKGLMEFMMSLRSYFECEYPEYSVPGNIYTGYMDMTYFSIVSKPLKDRKLKVAIVFVYEKFRFEIWLAAVNKDVQSKYWKLFKESGWDKYQIVPTILGYDSIVEYVVTDTPDFRDLDALTRQIETATVGFIKEVENFLSERESVLKG